MKNQLIGNNLKTMAAIGTFSVEMSVLGLKYLGHTVN